MLEDPPVYAPLDASTAQAIDRFADALWIEDGLAPLTLGAYGRDLRLLARWLQRAQHGAPLHIHHFIGHSPLLWRRCWYTWLLLLL